ncbi:MAG: GTP cyclohydrolase I FolE [Thiohalospira sp.]
MKKWNVSWSEIFYLLTSIDHPENMVYGVPKGGMIAAGFLQKATVTHKPSIANIILDDIEDSGKTRKYYEENIMKKGQRFHALFNRKDMVKVDGEIPWIVFPWEQDHPAGEDTVEQNIVRQLQYIGEDPEREGIKETPRRIVKSWDELYCGYNQSPADVLTTFEADGYDQIILLKDIELYSMCEHHMLPFYGKAHVAYIPDKKVIGISKLARLVDIFARRMQIQERIGEQVTTALMEYLKPLGAACIIEAKHLCMMARGVGKQNSVMTTSSIKGVFMDKPTAKAELINLIK